MKLSIVISSILFLTLSNIAHSKVGKYQIINASNQSGWVWVLNTETGQVRVCFETLKFQSSYDEIFDKQPFCSRYSGKN
jgi:hypothetical protein